MLSPSKNNARPQDPDVRPQSEACIDTGLACFVMLASFLEKPVDPHHLVHQYSPDGQHLSETALLRAARDLKFKAKGVTSSPDRLDKLPLPAIAVDREGQYFILAKIEPPEKGGRILVHDPVAGRAEAWPRDQFLERWNGRVILITTRAHISGPQRRFDISWFIPALVKYRRLFSEVLVASAFIQVFALMAPLFFMVIIDKVLVHKGLDSLDVLIFALIAISLFEVILGGLRSYVFTHTTNRIDVELGARLFRHLTRLPIAYFGARKVGHTVARVRELENIRSFITGSGMTLIVDLAFTIIFFAVMFLFSANLTWIVLGSIPFYIVVSLWVTPILRTRIDEQFRRGAEKQAFLVENINAIETVKASSVEPQMQRQWEDHLSGYVNTSFKTAQLSNIAQHGVQFIRKVTMALTLWFGARMVIDGSLTVGQLVAFNMLSNHVSQPILRVSQLWQEFQQARVSIDRLGDVLNEKAETHIRSAHNTLPPIRGDVTFDRVTFRYRPDGQEILKDVSLEVKAGEMIGIVGPSGSGKSTLTKLLQRLYVPEKGRILIDGTDLAMVDPVWLRRQIGTVLQENYLFNRSVRDNIALSEPSMHPNTVLKAAQLAGAHDFILELPQAYDTVVEERGSSLSGGQRQRIAIARALATNPRILIFDEATSALDYESEMIIQNNMQEMASGRTVFIVTHRLSTVRQCHRIMTVENGMITEQGTHKTLLKKRGHYAKLFQMQNPRE